MNDVITKCLNTGEVFFLNDLPRQLLTEDESNIIDYIFTYKAEYGVPPSVKNIADTFEFFIPWTFIPSRWEDKEPTTKEIFNDAVKARLLKVVRGRLHDAENELKRTGEVPHDILREIQQLDTLSMGSHTYSSFDRESYFRRAPISIPLPILNRAMGGISLGDYLLIAGRLGTGKSTLIQWLAKQWMDEGKKVLIVSTEMTASDVFSRIDAMEGGFNPLKIRHGDDSIMTTLTEIRGRTRPGEIFVPRSPLTTPAAISAYVQTMVVDVVIIDGAYLLQPSGGRIHSKWESVAAVSNELKQIAINLPTRIVATTQLKRGSDGTAGLTPEDLSYSDALGQDADFVLGIWPNAVVVGRQELQLIKNRYGPATSTMINFDYETMTLHDESVKGIGGKGLGEVISSEDWITPFRSRGGESK